MAISRRAYLLVLTLMAGLLLAFSGVGSAQAPEPVPGVGSAQAPEPVRSLSLPEYEGLGVVPSPQATAPPQEGTTRDLAPQEQTFSASATSSGATTLLKQPPFPPIDVSLLDSKQIYTDGPPMAPAAAGPTDEATLRQQLNALLVKRFGSGSAGVAEGLSIFDAASTKQIVPDPRLRAALVALKGTAGEPGIEGVLSGFYTKVEFGSTITPDAIAEVLGYSDGTVRIVFNQRYQYEDFRLLVCTMAHEPLHRDFSVSGNEELIANSMDTLVYGQTLLETPALASSGTELSRFFNTRLMARINTRDADGNLRLFTSRGNIFPGGVSVANYATLYPPDGVSTPGNAVLTGEVRNVVGPNVTLPATINFDDDTLLLLDANQAVFTDAQVVKLAQALKLNVYKPTITNNSPTGSITNRTPTIAATVSDRETDLAASNIKLLVDGVRKSTFSYDRSTNRLSYGGQRFAVGKHTVKIVATDAQGKVGTKTWTFTEV